jgi:hypothetical protein
MRGTNAAEPVKPAEKQIAQLVDGILREAHTAAKKIPDSAMCPLLEIAKARAQSGDTDGALALLQNPGTGHVGEYVTPNELRRHGIMQIAEDLANENKAARAMEMIAKAPATWERYREVAYKQVAVARAEHGDEAGAMAALARVKRDDDGYDAHLVVAVTLGKKQDIYRILKKDYEKVEPTDLSPKAWRAFATDMALLTWAGGKAEADRAIEHIVTKDKEGEALKKDLHEFVQGALQDVEEWPSGKCIREKPVSDDGDEPPADPKSAGESMIGEKKDREADAAVARQAVGAAQAGEAKTSLALVPHIKDEQNRWDILGKIAAHQAAKGDFPAAVSTARRIDGKFERSLALRCVAIKQAKAGDKAGASATFRLAAQCVLESDQDQRCITWAWARNGNVEDAVQWARSLDDPAVKALAFVGIARGLLRVH